MTEAQVVKIMRQEVKKSVSLSAWSRENGIDPSVVCRIFAGTTPPSAKAIAAIGIEKVVSYRKIKA